MVMTIRIKAIRYWLPLSVCSIVLIIALVACGEGTTTASAPMSSPTARLSLIPYTGNGYTIRYPLDWKSSRPDSGEVLFSDPTGMAKLLLGSADNSTGVPADATVHGILHSLQSSQLNFHPLEVPASTTVGGETWSQGAATYDAAVNGQLVPYKVVVLAVNHGPITPKLKGFLITYTAPTGIFDQVDRTEFQPMLQSFAFI